MVIILKMVIKLIILNHCYNGNYNRDCNNDNYIKYCNKSNYNEDYNYEFVKNSY